MPIESIQSTQSTPSPSGWVINSTPSSTDGHLTKFVKVTSRATANSFLTGIAAIKYVAFAVLTVVTFGRFETVREKRLNAYNSMGTALKGIVGYSTAQETTPPTYFQRMLASVRQYKVGAKALDIGDIAVKFLKDQGINAFQYCKEHKTRCVVIGVGSAVAILAVFVVLGVREVFQEQREICIPLCKDIINNTITPEDCINNCIRNTIRMKLA